MVILLIGGECSLMNALIDKLHKDKHRVYLITGKRERTRGYHMAVSQGETICKSYENTRGMETAVLRLDHLYGVPKKGKMEDNPCFDMILTAFKTKKIAANSRNEF